MRKLVMMDGSNVKRVAEIEAICFRAEKWSEQLFYDELSDPTKFYVVCLVDDNVVGFGGYAQILDEGHIMNIAVAPEFRKQGVASDILSRLLQIGKQNGIKAFTLEVRVSNSAAKILYEKTGFRSVGIRKKYYPDKEDAEIYWLYLE